MDIAISHVEIGPDEEALVLEVLRSGRLAQGPMVERLEEAFCVAAGSTHAVAVTSGTTALVAALQVLDLEPGDEVITSPFTFVATLNAILEAGAVARFVDIGPDFNLDTDELEAKLGDATRVLLPVHLYGYPADMRSISRLAADNGLAIVEDAAQAVGAAVDGQPVGSFGLGCFSLYATKNVMTGEGGIITTNDDDLAARLRVLRNQGMAGRYEYVMPGHNYRMTDIQAAIGIPQMARLAAINEARAANAAVLSEGLRDIPGLVTPPVPAEGRTHVFHQYTIRVTAEAAVERDDLIARLGALGIGAGIYYPKVAFDYDCYRDHENVIAEPVPRAEQVCREVVSLPVHPALSPSDLDRIVSSTRSILAP